MGQQTQHTIKRETKKLIPLSRESLFGIIQGIVASRNKRKTRRSQPKNEVKYAQGLALCLSRDDDDDDDDDDILDSSNNNEKDASEDKHAVQRNYEEALIVFVYLFLDCCHFF